MGLRDRRQDRREDRRGGGGTTYRMREKLFSIGDDYWIEDEGGDRAFKVDGKALRIRQTLVLEDASGRELLKIQERKLSIRDTMAIEDADGKDVATVKKAMISPLRERYHVKLAGGDELDVQGNIVDHEFEISRGRDKVAEVSKRWFRIADTYGVEIGPGENPALVLAIAVVVDSLSHDVG
ncbi:LURP-one-related/scramblase family protein [Nocardioides sp. URHA0032]|uniref:LURP-one-related/scramblase family protein n=1 Tax=Nocardioides sp. URHA0032 TaxID=1380388 RepID=UPI00048D2DC3|nr:LURP-one-related family protein [Nocardioides sp. URHA0032]